MFGLDARAEYVLDFADGPFVFQAKSSQSASAVPTVAGLRRDLKIDLSGGDHSFGVWRWCKL